MEEKLYRRICIKVIADADTIKMNERVHYFEKFFRGEIYSKVNNVFKGRWHIRFNETPPDKFSANIYTDDSESSKLIEKIIRENLEKGIIDKYNQYPFPKDYADFEIC